MSDEGSRGQHGGSGGSPLAADGPRRPCILTINGGSSSLKFAVFATFEPLDRVLTGCVERVGRGGSRLVVREAAGGRWEDRAVAAPDQAAAAGLVLEQVERRLGVGAIVVVGHAWAADDVRAAEAIDVFCYRVRVMRTEEELMIATCVMRIGVVSF